MAGGRVGLLLDPNLLASLGAGKRVALVSGTNGKTTTTALLAAAAGANGTLVATNHTGSNMPAGHVAALVGQSETEIAVLEVDEAYVAQVAMATKPAVIVLLNLSRDQLDRMSEVRMVAERWRGSLAELPATTVVANADDPLIVYAARDASNVVWVAGGLRWREDATGCPACGAHISFDAQGGWTCADCDLARPAVAWRLVDDLIEGPDGAVPIALSLPGRFNVENAVLAVAAAAALDVTAVQSAAAMSLVTDVAGRFVQRTIGEVRVRLMLAKNPAGWSALLDLVVDEEAPVVVSINARTADGADPSWLYDVDFGLLAGRPVVATGDRWRDLSVRLRYAEVAHRCESDPGDAVALAGADGRRVEFIGNYTAFRDLLERP